jgi:dTDP-glucose 4,6-dehydratase
VKLLVTGGLGFIGSNYILHTLSTHLDWEIVNLDKMGVGANPMNLRGLEAESRYSFLKGDISDPKAVRGALEEMDAVVNIAAETHVDRSISNPHPFLESNTLGTLTLLEAERRLEPPVRHIQVSTDEVYGAIDEGSFSEDDRLDPSNPYSATKAAADLLCNAYYRTYGMNITVTRCTNNYGPRQFPEKLIPKTIIRALKGMRIPVYGSGTNVRDWIYVLDHCKAINHVLERGEPGEVYNISSAAEHSVLEIVTRILNYLGKPLDQVSFVEDRPGHDRRYSLDSSKLRQKLGWKPQYEFEIALKDTVEWYTSNLWWWEPLVSEEVLHPTPWRMKGKC